MKPAYPGTVEVVPGVFIAFDALCPAVYIADDQGEIVTWNYDEMEDPSTWTASLMAVILAAKLGTDANRAVLDEKENPFDLLSVCVPSTLTIIDFLARRPICGTRASARRLIAQGAVMVNGHRVEDDAYGVYHGDKINIGKTVFVVLEEDL